MEENTQGNPKAVDDAVLGSERDDFFSALDQDVNGLVQEEEVTPQAQAQATPQVDSVQAGANVTDGTQNSEIDNLKKRYSDSSREAQGLKAQLNELKPFVPVLEAMKKDSGLVNHVKDYFQAGGKGVQDVKQALKLDEDFEFDPDDMVNNPDSDSRKVFNSMVGNIVNAKTNEVVKKQQQQAAQAQYQQNVKGQAIAFMKKHGLTQDEFEAFTKEAQQKIQTSGITFDDMYMLINQGKVSQNVANATKNDMLNQMKNVRDIPTSVSNANNAGQPVSQNDSVFDSLLNSDGNIEDLLG